ncbi:pentapeptide repeat-containing protein [Rhodococcus sp. 05-340-1]|uniref:pentapeptide repeat-containing protein n=1 Tax=Nocardiaceae TaxID=85025 RepID=UPI00050CF763|nr:MULTISPECIES: pentapeptide repeat-containing protein [Rhodococcus]OZC87763.1 pentapeptide repeat-containing protein [Rhodococcus sp. 06-412-2C]OZC96414.1 pentapeptide repeat-containing protein [Rhodococcus sp. 06-412-2B]OZD65397.1 pentapeptide repeat-containing protein [Rhodococcus sp. 05-340-2]OZD74557.1 pentapeptide repeat-containing protein [Rhodococcus sp. 05-340-1]OZD86671.1 pentapeptide repeat-containing protein [Rhodococcus sp. 05-339-2]
MALRKHPEQPEPSEPLLSLILLGIGASTLVGATFFYLFAWQQQGPFGNFFLTGVAGQQLFDAARTTLTLVGIVGLGGASFIAYRRQRTTENAQQTALRALALGQQQFSQDSVRALRERYTAATEQLGSHSFAVRLAGLYAIAALADDWRASGEPGEQQTCIDVICAYLRTPTIPMSEVLDDARELISVEDEQAGSKAEYEVRRTAVRIIAERTRPRATPPAPGSYPDFVDGPWSDRRFDLTGAELVDADFSSCTFDDLDLTNAQLLGQTTFSAAELRRVRFTNARFRARGQRKGGADFSTAHLRAAIFEDVRMFVPCGFERTKFKDSATFRGAMFTGSVSFVSARFSESSATLFDEVNFGTDHVTFARARFDGPVDLSKVDFTFTKSIDFTGATGGTPPRIARDTRDRFGGWPWIDAADPDTDEPEPT